MSWGEIAGHLTAVMAGTPPNWQYTLNKDPCAQRYIRLRDIAEYLKLEYTHLTRIRRGERMTDAFTAKAQARLSWFFHAQRQGRIEKEQLPDGTWHIVYRPAQQEAHADEAGSGAAAPARPLPRIIFTKDGVRLKV